MATRQDHGALVRARSLHEFARDLRFAVRQHKKYPGFTALVAGSLSLGIAINVSLFTVVNGLLLRPLPYVRADQLVEIE